MVVGLLGKPDEPIVHSYLCLLSGLFLSGVKEITRFRASLTGAVHWKRVWGEYRNIDRVPLLTTQQVPSSSQGSTGE